jgi:RNA polymerase sigma-70 factor (ECF subfamily)
LQAEDWKKIIEQHGPAVWQSAYRLLGNHADASDCFQETFVCAVEIYRRQPVRNLSALLSRLVAARAIDLLRLRFRNQKHSCDLVKMSPSPVVNDEPTNHLQKQELAENLRKVLAKLPRQEAAVFCLRYLDDMTYQQIAEELGITRSAAGVLLNRAKTRLRKYLETSSKERKVEVVK